MPLMTYLDEEPKGRDLWDLLYLFCCSTIIYSGIVSGVISLINPHAFYEPLPLPPDYAPPPLWMAIPLLFIAFPVIEELVCRLPLALVTKIWGKSRIVLVAVVLQAIVFGWKHAGMDWVPEFNPYHLLREGVHGCAAGLLFLKCGGLHRQYLKAFGCVCLVHIGHNSFVFVIGLPLRFLLQTLLQHLTV